MLAKLGQAGERLLNGDLKMMAGNALMIGHGFIVDEAAVGWIGDCYRNTPGAFAIRTSTLIVRRSRSLEGWNRLDRDGGFGQQVEEFWETGLHLVDVLAEVVNNSFCRSGLILRVVFDVVAEAGEIVVPVGFGERGHLRGNAIDLL